VTPTPTGWRAVPRTVWALGFVSLFMDVSSEMIHAFLPIFLISTLGASAMLVGVIEGLAEGTAAVTKVFSGALSDWFGKRKLLAGIGYGLGALTKPVFALAATPFEVLAARLVDRVGKGIRGARTSRPSPCAAPPTACGSRSTPSARSGVLCSASCSWPHFTETCARCSRSRSCPPPSRCCC
jgi:MFS family permease